MDNDKKELIYVMNLLKNHPQKEISKDYSSFKINKKFQFNMKSTSKFDHPVVVNDNFITNLFTKSSPNDTVFITLQENKLKETVDAVSENLSPKNTLTKQFSCKDIAKSNNTKNATFFQKTKPNLNITKFSNATRTASLLREHKWFNGGNNLVIIIAVSSRRIIKI